MDTVEHPLARHRVVVDIADEVTRAEQAVVEPVARACGTGFGSLFPPAVAQMPGREHFEHTIMSATPVNQGRDSTFVMHIHWLAILVRHGSPPVDALRHIRPGIWWEDTCAMSVCDW